MVIYIMGNLNNMKTRRFIFATLGDTFRSREHYLEIEGDRAVYFFLGPTGREKEIDVIVPGAVWSEPYNCGVERVVDVAPVKKSSELGKKVYNILKDKGKLYFWEID
jgi:hypothetical protein